jgi:hypothetical protein
MAACTSCSGHVDGMLERELKRDEGSAEGAGRRHLVETGELAELALERRGDRRGHDVRTGSRIEGEDLDGRIVDLGERGDGQLGIRHAAREKHGHGEERGGDGLEDEEPRRIHGCSLRMEIW